MSDVTIDIQTLTSFWLLDEGLEGRKEADKSLKANLDAAGFSHEEYEVMWAIFPHKKVGVVTAVIVPDLTKVFKND